MTPGSVENSVSSGDVPAAPGWSVYMVECADGSLYTGVTTDLGRRVKQHNDGVAARYTRARRPVRLVYAEHVADRSAALRREAAIKRYSVAAKRGLIARS